MSRVECCALGTCAGSPPSPLPCSHSPGEAVHSAFTALGREGDFIDLVEEGTGRGEGCITASAWVKEVQNA